MGKRKYLPVEKAPVPDFTPVPRRYRHNGWTPERQKAFIEALADTGCVDRAARMVNIAQTNCYALRRAPGAEEFRRAWDAALDLGVKRLKDIAFQRAIEGQLVPVFVGGKLAGYRRVYNDKLLMFCLRHYGEDGNGRRTTINYFSTRATAGAALRDGASAGSAPPQDERTVSAGAGGGPPPPCSAWSPSPSRGGMAEASATTVRTVIAGRGGGGAEAAAAEVLNGFAGVALDAEAEAAIAAALEACAARAREAAGIADRGGEPAADAAEEDPEQPFFRSQDPFRGLAQIGYEEFVPFVPGEPHWTMAGEEIAPELLRIEAERGAEGS